MPNDHDFPVALAPDPDGGAGALCWTAGILVITTLALALLNAGAIANWAQELPASPATAKLVGAAEAWQGTTTALGLETPHATLHGAWRQAESARWTGTARAKYADPRSDRRDDIPPTSK